MTGKSTQPSTSMDLPSPGNQSKADPSFVTSYKHPQMDTSTTTWNQGRKRKHSSSNDGCLLDRVLESLISTDQGKSTFDCDQGIPPKKLKWRNDGTPQTWFRLPMEVWQYVFSFLDPKTLGLLLRVNKAFHSYLTSGENFPQNISTQGVLNPMNSESIWSYSRKFFYPGMPRPLANKSELEMWNLIGATSCQFCRKPDLSRSSITSFPPLENDSGVEGVCIVWPFAIRTCAECLSARTRKVC